MHRKLGALLVSVLMLVSISAIFNSSIASGADDSLNNNKSPYDYANVFLGVDGFGYTIPGVGMPFPFNQWTPVMKRKTADHEFTPYWLGEPISGFRCSHFPSGSHMHDYGCFEVLPQTGDIDFSMERASEVSDEVGTPAYYAVTLNRYNVRVEITATMRAGIFRFKFLDGGDAHLLVDAMNANDYVAVLPEEGEIIAQNDLATGRGYVKNFHAYFVIKFDRPFSSYGVWSKDGGIAPGENEAEGYHTGAYVGFDIDPGEVVMAKANASFISFDQARANLEAEIPDWDFDKVKNETRDAWEKELNKIEVEGGTENQKEIFYTALYHALLAPHTASENGLYFSGFDGEVHEGSYYYNDFSLWDTFRAAHTLYTILEPECAEDMCQALVDKYEQGGWFPKWDQNGYTGVMIGTHSDSVIAETYLKGLTSFDVEKAYEGSYKHATQRAPPFYEAREGILDYIDLGYVPADRYGEATSRTLEFAYDDYCIAQLAKALGKEGDYEMFMERALYYKNVYDQEAPGEPGNPNVGYVRGKKSDGSWTDPGTFDPTKWYGYITEGDPYQYTWSVFHDVQGLIDLMGGRDNFNAKLDYFFEHSLQGPGVDRGSYYWHGNEPSEHDVYLYDWSGEPWRTQELARWVMETRYQSASSSYPAYPGNDDCGQMCAWYVFSAMGFYPVCPAGLHYEIGSPIFDKVTIHLPEYHYGGEDFVIEAHNVSDTNKYIQSATLNGEPLNTPWFWHSDLAEGGTLVFEMGPEPNYDWGSDPEDAPPSMAFEPEGDITPPEPFDLLTPEDGATVEITTPTLTWEASSDAGSGLDHYEVWVDGANIENTVTTEYTTTELPEGTYTWHVVAVDGAGNERQSESTFTFSVAPPVGPAEFVVENLSISPDEVEPGENVAISVDVANVGGGEGTYTVELFVNDVAVDNQIVTLAPAESEPVSFTVVETEIGSYSVRVEDLTGSFEVVSIPGAEFVVENLEVSPESVAPGEEVAISVDVANIGGVADSTLVELKIDGEVVDDQVVLLISGESKTVSFILFEEEPGSYAVSVDGLTGSFEVVPLPPEEGIPVWPIAAGIVVILAVVGGIVYRRRK